MPGRMLEERYLLEEEISSGGMGVVFRARDIRLDRAVAIKLAHLDADAPVDATSFAASHVALMDEAKTTGALEHPSIVPVYAMGITERGECFVVMKLVHGRTLASLIEGANRGLAEALVTVAPTRQVGIIERIAEAIAFAHARGVFHADLKPGNVMIGEFGEVQVMDWGLAAWLRLSGARADGSRPVAVESWTKTARNEFFGTPSYMAPEQVVEGRAPEIGTATDVFGIGAVGYHLLTGNPPYWGNDVDEVVRRAKSGNRNDPEGRLALRRFDSELLAIFAKCMATAPEARYPDVAALLEDLENLRESRPVSARPSGLLRRVQKAVRRHPTVAASLLAGMALVLLGVVVISQLLVLREFREHEDTRTLTIGLEQIDHAESRTSETLVASLPDPFDHDDFTWQIFEQSSVGILDLIARYGADLSSAESSRDSALAIRGRPILAPVMARAAFDLYRHIFISGAHRSARSTPAVKRLKAAWEHLPEFVESLGDHELGMAAMLAHRAWIDGREIDVDALIRLQAAPVEDAMFVAYVVGISLDRRRAIDLMEEVTRSHPSVATVRLRLMQRLIAESRRSADPKAVELLDRAVFHGAAALALNPASQWGGANMGLALELRAGYAARGMQATAGAILRAAVGHYQAVLARAPDHIPSLLGRASIELTLGRPGEALPFARRACELDERDPAAWLSLGLAYDRLVEESVWFPPLQQAIDAFAHVVALRPTWWEGHFRLGTALQSARRHRDAIESFRTGLTIHPKGIDLRIFLSESLWETGQHAAAMDQLLSVLGDFPDRDGDRRTYETYLARLPSGLVEEYREKLNRLDKKVQRADAAARDEKESGK